jgi:hypothetical protein
MQAIKAAHTAGIELSVAGNKLVVDAASEPPPSVIENLRRYKLEIVQLLRSGGQLPELPQIPESTPKPCGGGRKAAIEGGACRDQYEERAEAEAMARRASGIYDNTQTEHEANPYASALAALRPKCPDYVPADRWRQAIADATTFATQWGAKAQALGWTEHDLFGLHMQSERPAASYCRLSRYDETGLIWLLRGHPIIALTETIAAIQGATAVLTYRKLNKPALGPLGDSLDDIAPSA